MGIEMGLKTQRETETETDRQTDRQTDRDKERQREVCFTFDSSNMLEPTRQKTYIFTNYVAVIVQY